MEQQAVLTLEIVNRLQHAVLLHAVTRSANLMLFRCNGSAVPYDAVPYNYGSDQSVAPPRLAEHLRRKAKPYAAALTTQRRIAQQRPTRTSVLHRKPT